MNETSIRKIGAVILMVLGILTFATYSTHLILFKLSLPPYSIRTEGKYVAYSLEVVGFLYILPIIISMFLLAYLIHPSKFEKFYKILKTLFLLLAICGFGVTALLITFAIVNNFPDLEHIPNFIIFFIFGTSPFLVMGSLAVLAFEKDKVENMKEKYKLTMFTMLFLVLIISKCIFQT